LVVGVVGHHGAVALCLLQEALGPVVVFVGVGALGGGLGLVRDAAQVVAGEGLGVERRGGAGRREALGRGEGVVVDRGGDSVERGGAQQAVARIGGEGQGADLLVGIADRAIAGQALNGDAAGVVVVEARDASERAGDCEEEAAVVLARLLLVQVLGEQVIT
jgi:hypothetical protein